MSTITMNPEEVLTHGYDQALHRYIVVHPLDDVLEQKVNTETLGSMAMTASVKWSLISLRAYLILMFGMVLYRVMQLAGLFGGGH